MAVETPMTRPERYGFRKDSSGHLYLMPEGELQAFDELQSRMDKLDEDEEGDIIQLLEGLFDRRYGRYRTGTQLYNFTFTDPVVRR